MLTWSTNRPTWRSFQYTLYMYTAYSPTEVSLQSFIHLSLNTYTVAYKIMWIWSHIPRFFLNSDLTPICRSSFSKSTPLFLVRNLQYGRRRTHMIVWNTGYNYIIFVPRNLGIYVISRLHNNPEFAYHSRDCVASLMQSRDCARMVCKLEIYRLCYAILDCITEIA